MKKYIAKIEPLNALKIGYKAHGQAEFTVEGNNLHICSTPQKTLNTGNTFMGSQMVRKHQYQLLNKTPTWMATST